MGEGSNTSDQISALMPGFGLKDRALCYASSSRVVQELCLPKTLSGMTRGWAYGNEAADGRVSDPAAVCFPLAAYTASAA